MMNKRVGLWQRFRNLQSKRRNSQLEKVISQRERSISILQNRYGFTREKATSELDRHYPKARLD
jgi:hypothetical protein